MTLPEVFMRSKNEVEMIQIQAINPEVVSYRSSTS